MQNVKPQLKNQRPKPIDSSGCRKRIIFSLCSIPRYFQSLRNTLHASRDTISSNETRPTSDEYMQNKAKVKIGKMNVSIAVIKDYDKKNEQSTTNVIKNKPKQSQF